MNKNGEGILFMKVRYNLPCNIAQSLNIIGDRWSLLIIHEIFNGQNQFNEIKKAVPGISSNLLSERLKYLEKQGLIQSALYSSILHVINIRSQKVAKILKQFLML